MKNEKLYWKAIEIGADYEEKFLKAMEANKTMSRRELAEMHHQLEVAPAASAACAVSDLISSLFGVSEERVDEDLKAHIASRQ